MKKIICGSFNVFLSAMALILCFQSTVFAYETFLCTGGDFEKDIGDFGDECVLYVRDEAKISRTGCSVSVCSIRWLCSWSNSRSRRNHGYQWMGY